jgi:hypothetical protein
MPELKIPELKLPDLREMSREDIGRAISDVRLPDVDLSTLDPRRVDLSKVERPKIDLSRLDVQKAVDTVAVAAHLRKRSSSPIRFIVGGIAVAGLAVFAILNIPALRARVQHVTRSIRGRAGMEGGYGSSADPSGSSSESSGPSDRGYGGSTDSGTQGYTPAVAVPIQPDAYADSLPSATGELETAPDALTAGTADRVEDEDRTTI